MKLNKFVKMFFEEADDLGGGSDDGISATDLLGEPQVEPKSEPKPAPAVTNLVDADALASKFGDALGKHFPKSSDQATAQPKQLTPEEAKKLLNVWEPDDAFLQEFDNIDSKKVAIAKMRDYFIKQADTLSQVRMQNMQEQMQKQFEDKYGPIAKHYEVESARGRQTRFETKYPDLAKPELSPLLQAVATGLQAQGKSFDSEESLFDELAKGVEAVIKVNNPEFKLTATQVAAIKQQPNKIPVTTPGSGGAAGAGGGKGATTGGKTPLALKFLS